MADEHKPDTVNFVEHLRLAHLTLVLTCVISIIALWSQEPSSAGRAYVQLNALLQLRDNWKAGQWIHDVSGVDRLMFGEADGTVNGEAPTHFRFVSSIQYIRSDGSPVTRGAKPLFDKELAPLDFADVKHARVIFDALKDVTQVAKPLEIYDGWRVGARNHPEPQAITLNGGKPLTFTRVGVPTGSYSGRQLNWYLRQDLLATGRQGAVAALVGAKQDKSYFVDFGSPIALPSDHGEMRWMMMESYVFPSLIEKTDVNLLKELKDTSELRALTIGNFDAAFPDLAERTRHLSDVPLENLRDHFQEESVRSADKIDVSFLKFPPNELAYVGTSLIFMLTFYVCAVLQDFCSRVVPGDKAWDVAWVGLSREAWSMALFWASVIVLPLSTVVLLAWKAVNLGALARVGIMATAVLAFGVVLRRIVRAWWMLQKVERRVPAAPAIT
ncbi:hypothetical protein [Bradyrhizobium sp. USDA 4454]